MGGGGNGEPGGACGGRGRWTWGGVGMPGGVGGSGSGGGGGWGWVLYGRWGEGEVDMERRWRSWWCPGERERRERGLEGLWWPLG